VNIAKAMHARPSSSYSSKEVLAPLVALQTPSRIPFGGPRATMISTLGKSGIGFFTIDLTPFATWAALLKRPWLLVRERPAAELRRVRGCVDGNFGPVADGMRGSSFSEVGDACFYSPPPRPHLHCARMLLRIVVILNDGSASILYPETHHDFQR
jgi:hypothetical protein